MMFYIIGTADSINTAISSEPVFTAEGIISLVAIIVFASILFAMFEQKITQNKNGDW